MALKLIVKADHNDADYITRIENIDYETYQKFKSLIEAVMSRNPDNKWRYNWDRVDNYRDEDYPDGPECYYGKLGFDKALIKEFDDRYVPIHEFGIHSIVSIRLWEVTELKHYRY